MLGLIRIFLVTNIFCVYLSSSSFSQDTVKSYIDPYGDVYRGAIEIKLDAGWHTYWNHPGVNGFKPKITIVSSENVNKSNFFWPFPKILGPVGYEYLGYDKSPLIPFEISKLDREKFLKLEIELTYGICKKICLVKNRVLKIDKDFKTNFSDSKKVELAFKRIPSESTTFSETTCTLNSSSKNFINITLKNKGLKNKKNIELALIDYKDQNSLITDQTFNAEEGTATAVLFSEKISLANIDPSKLSIIFSVDGSAKKLSGCRI